MYQTPNLDAKQICSLDLCVLTSSSTHEMSTKIDHELDQKQTSTKPQTLPPYLSSRQSAIKLHD
jgi:hypothetical protein